MWLFKLVNLLRTQMVSPVAGAIGRLPFPGETTLQVGKVNMHLFAGGARASHTFQEIIIVPFKREIWACKSILVPFDMR